MRRQGRWRRLLGQGLLALGLAGGAGCINCLHPVRPPRPEVIEPCQVLPKACRSQVYVFFVNGLDPLNKDNLTGVRDYVQALGFIKTYYGQIYHVFWFDDEIRRLHQEVPDARFVLVGYGRGANMVRSMAHTLQADDVPIDVLMYLGGESMKPGPCHPPENVHRVINIMACGAGQGCHDLGDSGAGVETICVTDVGQAGLPTHPETLDILTRELMAVAATVPVVMPKEEPLPPQLEEAPTPRPVQPQSSKQRDEWDFLKPVSQLKMPGSEPATNEPPVAKPARDSMVAK